MQRAPTQPQVYRQDQWAYNSGFSGGLSPVRAPDAMPAGSAQQMARLYDTQPHTGIVRDAALAPSGAGRGNDAYGASSILEHRFNYAMTDSSGIGAPTPLHYGQYAMVSMFYITSRDDSRCHEAECPVWTLRTRHNQLRWIHIHS